MLVHVMLAAFLNPRPSRVEQVRLKVQIGYRDAGSFHLECRAQGLELRV